MRFHREGKLSDAIRVSNMVLAARPGDLQATLLLGVIAAQQHQEEVAVPLLSAVAEKYPFSFNAFFWLSMVFREVGRKAEALEMSRKAVNLNDKQPNAINQLGLCFLDLEYFESALDCFRKAARVSPHVSTIQLNIGVALEALGRNEDAMKAFRLAIALDPSQIQAQYRIGRALVQDLDYQGGEACARNILDAQPDCVPAHLLMALAYVGTNDLVEADKHVTRALELEPDNADTLTQAGSTLQMLGQVDRAVQTVQKAIEIDPLQGSAYYVLVRSQKIGVDQSQLVERMEQIAKDPNLGRGHRGTLHYALGKAHADLGEFETAMSHFNSANRVTREVKFGNAPFEQKLFADSIDFAIRNLDREFIERYRSHGSQETLPILVVGMMRSGTTLVEQILSSHPDIGAAGEQLFWFKNRGVALNPPGNVLNEERFSGLIDEYLALLHKIEPEKLHVVDKLPGNYTHLGIIHTAFPNARIIHVRRHPIDTCLSIWSTPNSTRLPWANEKKDLVFAYGQYLRVMEHWRNTLPANRLLEVNYEDLVTETERVSRQMVDFCGLPWDDQCLHPENNSRAVATPSAWQVRQPIYRTALGRWREYEPWLDEFRELLPS